jgi:hypothetical protein
MTSPEEGLWSVATNWSVGWPTGWAHGGPNKVEHSGDWMIVSGSVPLSGGAMMVREAYRLEDGLVRAIREGLMRSGGRGRIRDAGVG